MRLDWVLPDTRGVRSRKQRPLVTDVRWRRAARRTRAGRTIGGTLPATSSQLTHTPDFRNWPTDRSPVEVPFAQIAAIGVLGQNHERVGRELRRRLRVDCRNGVTHLFLIEDPAEAARALNELIRIAPTEPADPSHVLYDAWMASASA